MYYIWGLDIYTYTVVFWCLLTEEKYFKLIIIIYVYAKILTPCICRHLTSVFLYLSTALQSFQYHCELHAFLCKYEPP